MIRLFHFTCDHGRLGIAADLMLRPFPVGLGLLWLTDLPAPSAEEVGLTSYMLRCNRLAYIIEVDTCDAVPWTHWAHGHRIGSDVRMALDGSTGARPAHWWVSEGALPAVSIRPNRNAAFTRNISKSP